MSSDLFGMMDATVFATLGDAGTVQFPDDDTPRPASIFVHRDVEYFPEGGDVPAIERRTEIGIYFADLNGERPPRDTVITLTDTGESWRVDAVVYADLEVVRVVVR